MADKKSKARTNKEILLEVADSINAVHTDIELVKNEMSHIKEDVKKNTVDLEMHIEGVLTNKARLDNEIESRKEEKVLIEKMDTRLLKVEKISNWLTISGKFIIVLGAIAAFGTWICKLLGYI